MNRLSHLMLLLPIWIWGSAVSCAGNTTTVPAAGGATGEGGAGGDEQCVSPPDGICDLPDDCDCLLCQPGCDGGCMPDGFCALGMNDSCTCSDCDWDLNCIVVDGVRCNDDGTCDPMSEGCGCGDCHGVDSCSDNVSDCDGGAPDGLCAMGENCNCSDCLGKLSCSPCDDADTQCGFFEPCICGDCAGMMNVCGQCFNDGTCEWSIEDCTCADCAAHPLCQ